MRLTARVKTERRRPSVSAVCRPVPFALARASRMLSFHFYHIPPLRIPCIVQVIPSEGRVETFGGPFEPRRKFKWLRAVVTNDGDVFGIPAHGLSVLRIRPTTDEVHTVGEGTVEEGKWMCHGAGLAANNCIYGIPSNGSRVLKVEVETSRVSYIGEPMPGGYKWCVLCPFCVLCCVPAGYSSSTLGPSTVVQKRLRLLPHGMVSCRHRLGGGLNTPPWTLCVEAPSAFPTRLEALRKQTNADHQTSYAARIACTC